MKANEQEKQFCDAITTILKLVGEDPMREGLIKTPQRVFKAFEHLCSGYNQ
ncbi:MAG: GTP cyclohydrolase I, partial [Campylobacterales bacterium]